MQRWVSTANRTGIRLADLRHVVRMADLQQADEGAMVRVMTRLRNPGRNGQVSVSLVEVAWEHPPPSVELEDPHVVSHRLMQRLRRRLVARGAP